MSKFVLASVGTVQFFDQSSGDLIVTSKTLVDSGINFSVTAEDIRGGNWTFRPPPIFSNEYGVMFSNIQNSFNGWKLVKIH